MSQCYVYFLQQVTGGPIKIGNTYDPELRSATIGPWCPEPVQIIAATPGDIALERNIQNCFADCHYHHEWFHPAPRLMAVIDGLNAGEALTDLLDLSDIRGNVLGLTQAATRKRNGTTLGRKRAA